MPAVKVVVFQWPWGTAVRHRSPFSARPSSRAILVEAPVSSMKIRWCGSRSGSASTQVWRRARTSGLSCSAAWAVFFIYPAALGQKIPNRDPANAHAPLQRQLLRDFVQRDIRLILDQDDNEVLMRIKLGAPGLALTDRFHPTMVAPLPMPVDRRRHANGKPRRRRPSRQVVINRFNYLPTKVDPVCAPHGCVSDLVEILWPRSPSNWIWA